MTILLYALTPPQITDEAGDGEHCRHRQHLRKRFRSRLLGGFFHTHLPRLGRDSSLRQKRKRRPAILPGNTPRRVFALMSPHSANIDSPKLEQHCGGILTQRCRDLRTVGLTNSPAKTAGRRGTGRFGRWRKLLLRQRPPDTLERSRHSQDGQQQTETPRDKLMARIDYSDTANPTEADPEVTQR